MNVLLKSDGAKQLGLGIVIFNLLFGWPLALYFSFGLGYMWVAALFIPLACIIPVVIGFFQSQRDESGLPWFMWVWLALFCLQFCAMGCVLLTMGKNSNSWYWPAGLFLICMITRKVLWMATRTQSVDLKNDKS